MPMIANEITPTKPRNPYRFSSCPVKGVNGKPGHARTTASTETGASSAIAVTKYLMPQSRFRRLRALSRQRASTLNDGRSVLVVGVDVS